MRNIAYLNTLFILTGILFLTGCTGQTDKKRSEGSAVSSADSSTKSQPVNNKSVASTDSLSGNADPNDPEQRIRATYAETLRLKNEGDLDSTAFKYSCNNEKSGQVVYYSSRGKLKLITHSYSEYDHFTSEDQYLLEDEQLCFVYQRSVTWSFESGPEGSTKDNITEKRMYLADDKPLKCLEKKFTIRSQATNNPKSEQVPSKEVNCSWSPGAEKEFKLLAKYYNKPAPSCLK